MNQPAPPTLADRIEDDIWAARESVEGLNALAATLTSNLAVVIALASCGNQKTIGRNVDSIA